MKTRVITILVSLCIVLTIMPISYVQATETQCAMYLFKDVLSVSCYHKRQEKYPDRKPFDIISTSAPKADAYAPFDCKVVDMPPEAGNAIIIVSSNPVRFADGTTDYMTVMVAHDDDISDIYVGKTYKQGEVFYQQGNTGVSFGNHIHVEIARGEYTKGNVWTWMRDKSRVVNINDAFYLYANTKFLRDSGYVWRTFGETVRNNPSASVTTGICDNLTQTSATLRGSFTTIGARASECGMYIGTSANNLKKLGSDKVNTYGTSMYYSTSKYGYTLELGKTYYYQAYAKANGTTYKGEIKSFTTPGENASISLDRTSLTMKNGTCTQLTATTNPAGQTVTWSSSDTSVATVTSNGGIDTRKAGTTTITAKMTYNNTTYSTACKVTVTDTQATVTTKGADSISQTSAIVRGEVKVSSGTVTECGMYIGKSASSLTKLGSDKISKGTTFYYSTSKYGYALTASTTYYYQAYAIVDGATIWGDVRSFTTEKAVVATTSAAVTTKGADSISQTSAIVRGEVTVSSGTVTECGMYIGGSASSLTKLGSDKISKGTPFYYSTSKYGYALTAGTTYYYQAYAVVDGTIIWGDVRSFTTEKAVVATTSATVTTKGADNITQTSAIVRGEVTVSSGTVTECGMYIGKSASSLSKLGSDTIRKGTPFYYSTSKYGYSLTAGTTYYYQSYAIVDGKMIWGDVKSFTTAAATVSATTRTATVVNTNGQYLAINNAPAASPKYSTQIGRIPPAGTVTVDTSKTSGSWYWVTYDGVSGYAYGKYLSLN